MGFAWGQISRTEINAEHLFFLSDLSGCESWRKLFLETAQGVLSFASEGEELRNLYMICKDCCSQELAPHVSLKPKFSDELVT